MMAERMNNLGTESAFTVLARAQALAAAGKPVINLGIGQPDFQTAPHIVEAAVKALKDGHHGYTAANGTAALREAVAADIQRWHGAEVSPSNILCVPGGKVTMAFAMLMFGEAGAEIMFPDPGFPIYESMIRFSGATPVPMRLGAEMGFSFRAADVLAKITDRTRLIILNSPANPTGGVTDRAELDALVAGLEAWPQVHVLSDEIYSRMTYDGERHISLLDYPQIRERLIILNGWSKTWAMTGWRLGWGLWPDHLIDGATKLAINTHSCVNAAAQFAGIAAMEGPQDAVDQMMTAFDARRRFVTTRLNGIDGISSVTPKGAFYAFPDVSALGLSSDDLQNRLLDEAHVAFIAGTSFGAHGEGFLRLSYASSMEQLEEALDRLEAYTGRL